MEPQTKNCQNCKSDFTIESEDFSFYEQMKVPPPTWCPGCRRMRRLAWWGYRILYKRKCDKTGKDVITVYHPDLPIKMYASDVWYSDSWDPKEYGREYDFSRPFFEQWKELFDAVPKPALHVEYSTMVESDYCNAASQLRNCYLGFKTDRSENSGYLNAVTGAKDSFDVAYSNYVEMCYESVNINKCFQTFWSIDCDVCSNVWFSRDLSGCTDCVGCINLRGKNHCIFNEQYSKEEYKNKIKEFDFGTPGGIESFKRRVEEFFRTQPRPEFHRKQTVNVSGEYLYQCKNVHDSYLVSSGEDIRYSEFLQKPPGSRKAYDWSAFGFNAEWIYDSAWVGINANHVKFSFWNYRAYDIEYSFGCHGSGNLFGCVGIRKGEYCILNRRYSKEVYGELLLKIKKHMDDMPYIDSRGNVYKYGEFFPSEFSPWVYNESHAYEFAPLAKGDAIRKGFRWRDPDVREYQDATTILPEYVKDTNDSVVKEILKCKVCGKNYRLIPIELQFYKRFNVAIPRCCPLCRHYVKVALLNPMSIHDRTCGKCGKNIKTSYAPDRTEIVYCEQCYNSEVA